MAKASTTAASQEQLRLLVIFICLAVAFSAAGYLVGNMRLIHVEQENRLFAQQRDSLHERLQRLEYRNNILQVELDVERAASRGLQQELRVHQDEIASIRRELAFYQRVMAPELNADGIAIDSLTITALASDNSYYFRLILLQMERIEQLAQGSLRITLRGFKANERQEYSMLALAGIDDGATSFVMNYFSLTEGSVTLPEGFIPETVTVHVRSRQGRQTERTYQWQELINGEDSSE